MWRVFRPGFTRSTLEVLDKDDGFNEYSVDVTVSKAILTVTADDQSKTYARRPGSRVYGHRRPSITATPTR